MRIDLTGYRRPALQFSGGKDSLACLYLLKDQLDAITVYWLNTGDGCPETRAVIDAVRDWIPHFVEITTDVRGWRETNGHPSDLVPAKAHAVGMAYGLCDFKLTTRMDCCWHNLMLPMHQRMVEDGVDLVIRGTKKADTGTVPAEGKTDFYDVLLPVVDWTHDQVFDYLDACAAPKNAIYEHFRGISAPECFGCTAWWDDGKAEYLRHLHPEFLPTYQNNLRRIAGALASHLSDLHRELN
jgi:phosphoadenosine phosphosulfate reductase